MQVEQESIQCSLCGNWLPPSGYHIDKRSPNGRASACKACRRPMNRPHYEKYGLSIEDFERMTSDRACPLCQRPVKRWVIDHDHSTGKVRGALWANCNTAIGMFSDDVHTLLRAVAYLERASAEGEKVYENRAA